MLQWSNPSRLCSSTDSSSTSAQYSASPGLYCALHWWLKLWHDVNLKQWNRPVYLLKKTILKQSCFYRTHFTWFDPFCLLILRDQKLLKRIGRSLTRFKVRIPTFSFERILQELRFWWLVHKFLQSIVWTASYCLRLIQLPMGIEPQKHQLQCDLSRQGKVVSADWNHESLIQGRLTRELNKISFVIKVVCSARRPQQIRAQEWASHYWTVHLLADPWLGTLKPISERLKERPLQARH